MLRLKSNHPSPTRCEPMMPRRQLVGFPSVQVRTKNELASTSFRAQFGMHVHSIVVEAHAARAFTIEKVTISGRPADTMLSGLAQMVIGPGESLELTVRLARLSTPALLKIR